MNEDIELKLNEFLRPISPEEDFIEHLKSRLFNKQGVIIENPNYIYAILFICLSFSFGIGLIFIFARFFRKTQRG